MNKWMKNLERRYGNLYIPELTKLLVGGRLAVWVIVMFINQNLLGMVSLTRYGLLKGQLWRAVTFVFVPTLSTSLFYAALELYFLYWVGNALENRWGGFRYNLYVLVGMVGSVLACLLTGYGSSQLLTALFLAFACLFPEVQVLLFFFIPVKVKWMGIAAGVFWLLEFVQTGFWGKIAMVLGLLNWFVFFVPELIDRYQKKKRRDEWKNQFYR